MDELTLVLLSVSATVIIALVGIVTRLFSKRLDGIDSDIEKIDAKIDDRVGKLHEKIDQLLLRGVR